MNIQKKKCVMILDEALPPGLIANTAAIMGISIGKEMPEIVGRDVTDQAGSRHPGIITFPVPVLKAAPAAIREIRRKLCQPEFSGLTAVDFPNLAQGSKTYEEYMEKMSSVPVEELQYLGIAICGEKKKVTQLTGNLALLR